MKSWNEEINKTLAMAGVTFEQVPQQPDQITVKYGSGERYITRNKNSIIVRGVDASGRSTTHFIDRDTWK